MKHLTALAVLIACSCGGSDNFHEGALESVVQDGSADYRRTVVFIYAETWPDQDLFIRGGIDHVVAHDLLGKDCSDGNRECAIPIRHRNLQNATTRAWKEHDDYLDWYGAEPGQDGESNGMPAEGTAADWTTNFWPAFWGDERTVAVDGFGSEPLNRFGMHYWMVDVEMDCSRAVPADDAAWFEFKAFVSNGPGWEAAVIRQPGAPYPSDNHFGQCGMLNVFRYGEDEAHILPIEIGADPVLIGASDIAWSNDGKDRTAALLDRMAPAVTAIFTAGDNIQGAPVCNDEAIWEFAQWFDPSWGRHLDKLLPAAGNHDYWVDAGQAYYDYFGPAAGESGLGYYAYDPGPAWHVVVLNSNLVDDAGLWAAQLDWLGRDLDLAAGQHVLAIFHHPRFSSGPHGNNWRMQAIWEILARHQAEIVISGHDHIYERFARQDPYGWRDEENGIRQFIVGTGGMTMYGINSNQPNSELRQTGTFGLLRLGLHESWYEWTFVPVDGGTFVDTGSTFCH